MAVRLKVDRGKISEIEQLYDRAINDAAIPLLTTPRPGLVTDIPAPERTSREVLAYAANSYFDALESDDGKIAAFADDWCPSRERLPDRKQSAARRPHDARPATAESRYSARQRPAPVQHAARDFVDQQKGVATIFCLFVHDGTRRAQNRPILPEC